MDLSVSRKAAALRAALNAGLLDQEPPILVLYDLDVLAHRLHELRVAFPTGTLHTVAMKANPLSAMLRYLLDQGFGAECASRVEVEHALRVGYPPVAVVFDSPAKTDSELAHALATGICVNVDNLQELDRCAAILGSSRPSSMIGLRINPSVGSGTIAATGTVAPTSKFGVTLDEHRELVIDAFRRHEWLRSLHVHAGSQGCGPELVADAVARVVDLAGDIEGATGRRLERLNLGGGLPVCYTDDVLEPKFEDLTAAFQRQVPEIFSGRWPLATEFGRSLHAQAGWVASRVEATKRAGGRRIAIIHAGADMFVRTAYAPTIWPHRVVALDRDGNVKAGSTEAWDVAGPLCFSGDLVSRGADLPPIERGDILAVLDAGAYTLSMWSRYNSRQAPAVWAYSGEPPTLRPIKAAESMDDVLRFWGCQSNFFDRQRGAGKR